MPYYPERKPEEPEKEPAPEERKQEPAAHKRLWAVLLCLCTAAVLYGAVRLIGYGAELSASRETSRELQRISEATDPPPETAAPAAATAAAPSPTPPEPEPKTTETVKPERKDDGTLQPVPYPDNPGLKIPDRFVRLRKKSGYIVGWISLDGVEEPVALKDNTFFLNHDAEGKKNSNGAIFLDEETNLLTRPYTLYLYGHNMKSGNMFGRLKKYLDSSYCYRHRVVTFDSLYEDGQYAVFAAAEFSTLPGKATYFDLWALDSKDREERERAIRRLTSMTPYDALLDVRPDEQILLLVTCIDEDTDRLVVAARRLREGETETQLHLRKE